MGSQRQPGSLDVMGSDDDASGVLVGAGAGRGEQAGWLGGGTAFRRCIPVGARLLAQPLRVGPGFIWAGLHTSGQGLGEHERGGGLQGTAEQIGRAGRLKTQRPPVLPTGVDLGQFHLAPRLLAQARAARRDLPAGQWEPADAPPSAYRPPAGQVTLCGRWCGPTPGITTIIGRTSRATSGHLPRALRSSCRSLRRCVAAGCSVA
jgi:hypothetical protein